MRDSDPTATVVATDHTHGDPQGVDKPVGNVWSRIWADSEVAIELMAARDISCQNMGSHAHGPTGERHHHHDLTCLIEAGANTIRPRLEEVEGQVTRLRRRNDGLRSRLQDLEGRVSSLRNMADRLVRDTALVERFMEMTPAQGPWQTVSDQYAQWLEEEKEASRADPDRVHR